MESKAPIILRIEKLESDLEKLKRAFIDHWNWHRGEEKHMQEAATHFHERMGIVYAIAQSRDDACRGAFVCGPTPDLVKLRDNLAEDGDVMVMVEAVPGGAERQIVAEWVAGKWKDVVPPERLP